MFDFGASSCSKKFGGHCLRFRSLDSSSFSKKLWGTLLAICDFGILSTNSHGDTACDCSIPFRNKLRGTLLAICDCGTSSLGRPLVGGRKFNLFSKNNNFNFPNPWSPSGRCRHHPGPLVLRRRQVSAKVRCWSRWGLHGFMT